MLIVGEGVNMQSGRIAELKSRDVVSISGIDARAFLQNLVTCDMDDVEEDAIAFGALLTPQGKILFDFFIFKTDGGYLLDASKNQAADLAKRLAFYRLRAKVEIADVSDKLAVLAVWGTEAAPDMPATLVRDPRLAALGFRAIASRAGIGAVLASPRVSIAEEADYHSHRIGLGVAEGGVDYAYGDAFPHDADMDDLNGVAFSKGCFVGQEVVSRMKHRGMARRRVIIAHGDADLPPPGTEILAGGKPAGTLGSSSGAVGLALARLDRIHEAVNGGQPVTAAGVTLRLSLPAWASFGWPTVSDDE